MIIDAKDLILGRMATYAAKKAIIGEDVVIINCEEAAISGNRKNILERYLAKFKKGQPHQGPYTQARPDKFVRRVVRGMIPWKHPRGREVFKRITCYIGIPEELKGKKTEQIANAGISKLPNYRYMYIKELCKHLGGTKWQPQN